MHAHALTYLVHVGLAILGRVSSAIWACNLDGRELHAVLSLVQRDGTAKAGSVKRAVGHHVHFEDGGDHFDER